MKKPDPRLYDESDLLYAPGLKRRPRKKGPDKRMWLPRDTDVKAGFVPRSIDIPARATEEECAALCRKYQRDLIRWRETGTTAEPKPEGTWADAIEKYRSLEFSPYHSLADATRREYDRYMETIEKRIGKRPVATTTEADLWRWYKMLAKCPLDMTIEDAGRAGLNLAFVYAKHHMGMIRRLARFAGPDGTHIEVAFAGPLRGRMRGGKARTAYPTWNDIVALVRAADRLGNPSVGTATLMQFELAQRQGDIIGRWADARGEEGGVIARGKRWRDGVQWQDISPEWTLRIIQNKTGKELLIDLTRHPELKERLEQTPMEKRVGPVIVREADNLPYTQHQFWRAFQKAKAAAGWPAGLQSMDARAGAATEAANGGATTKQVQSITGHATEQMASRYARPTPEQASKVTELRRNTRGQTGNG